MSDELAPVPCPSTNTLTPLKPGKLRIQLLNCYLNVKIKRPYVVLTLGDQIYQTTVSEFQEGRWNECFEFTITFHIQLFGTLQLDLYDQFTLYPDKHVGRAEIRLSSLENMPETFISYYEIWDKKLSNGASSSIGRERAGVNNVGAMHVKFSYRYQTAFADYKQNSESLKSPTQSAMTERQLSAEFRENLQLQREKRQLLGDGSVEFKKCEEGDMGNVDGFSLDYPDESDDYDDTYGDNKNSVHHNPIAQPLKMSRTRANSSLYGDFDSDSRENIQKDVDLSETSITATIKDNSKLERRSSSWLTFKSKKPPSPDNNNNNKPKMIAEDDDANPSSFGSLTGMTETSQVIRSIQKILATFNQGFELSNMQTLTGLTVLERFYSDFPRSRSWDIVENLSEIDTAARFWKFSIASYGWKGLNFIGKGNGILSDAIRQHSDAKSIVEYLMIPKDDLLAYEFRPAKAFMPSYFIARDRFTNSIVLSIRGTMSVLDTLTDMVCEYEPFRDGFVHSGMKTSAYWFLKNVVPQLIDYSNIHSTTGLIIVGHSLGASTAAILTMLLTDYIDEFRRGKEEAFTLQCYGYAPACGLSLELAETHKDIIHSFVFAEDIVSRLSYGSLMDVKEMIIASSEAIRSMGISKVWSGTTEGEKWKAAFKRIEEVRERLVASRENPKMYVAGQIYQFWMDPTPSNDTRIVMERATAIKACSEIVVKKSIILDHLPTNFDVAFRRARETVMREGSQKPLASQNGLDKTQVKGTPDITLNQQNNISVDLGSQVQQKDVEDEPQTRSSKGPPRDEPHVLGNESYPIWDAIAKLDLKGTTDPEGGKGKVLGDKVTR